MKKALSSRLRSEELDADECHKRRGENRPSQYHSDHGSRIKQNPFKVPATFRPGHHLPADEYLQEIVGGDQSPTRWRVADI